VFKDRASALNWDGHEVKAATAGGIDRRRGPTFAAVAMEWWALVEAGTYARRAGRAKKLAESTKNDYRLVLFGTENGTDSRATLIARCGRRPLAALDDPYWQRSWTSWPGQVSRTPGSRRTSL
jgi:hypothetical protein